MPRETLWVLHSPRSIQRGPRSVLAIGHWVERNLWERRLAANDLLIGARRTSHKIHQHLTYLHTCVGRDFVEGLSPAKKLCTIDVAPQVRPTILNIALGLDLPEKKILVRRFKRRSPVINDVQKKLTFR